MKKLLIIPIIFLLAGCSSLKGEIISEGSNSVVKKVEDKESNVTCWIYKSGYAGGISCLPDKQFKQ